MFFVLFSNVLLRDSIYVELKVEQNGVPHHISVEIVGGGEVVDFLSNLEVASSISLLMIVLSQPYYMLRW